MFYFSSSLSAPLKKSLLTKDKQSNLLLRLLVRLLLKHYKGQNQTSFASLRGQP